MDRVPPDGKRTWRERIEGFVTKNYQDYHRVVGVTIGLEDVEQDVMLAVWMVWDRYYNPNFTSAKTGKPVKLCTYVWRAIQTAWAKVTERCFCVRNTIYMERKEDVLSEENKPIRDKDVMKAILAETAGVSPSDPKLDALTQRCRTPHDKQPFTRAILADLASEAGRYRAKNSSMSALDCMSFVLSKVIKKRRNAVPAHMVMKSLDAPSGCDEEASKNSDLVEDTNHRIGSKNQEQHEMVEQIKQVVFRHLDPTDQHILFGCIASERESVRSVANQYHMTVADVKERIAHITEWIDEARCKGMFDDLLE